MDTIQKRNLLFLFGCIGTRSLLVYLAKQSSKKVLFYMGLLALLPTFGFFYLYFSGTRQTGAEVFGAKIWWNNLRPIHGTLYALFAYNAIIGNPNAYLYLLVDVILGLLAFTANRSHIF